jgi:hypothetical protein
MIDFVRARRLPASEAKFNLIGRRGGGPGSKGQGPKEVPAVPNAGMIIGTGSDDDGSKYAAY